jgi:hypothetical protein
MDTLLSTCMDTTNEQMYFKDLINLLRTETLPNKKWEEPIGKTNCQKCDIDHFQQSGCVQVVLGRLQDTQCYLSCKQFYVLNISDWTIDKNDLFIEHVTRPGQIIEDNLVLCDTFPIRLCIRNFPEHELEKGEKGGTRLDKYSTKIIPGSVTTRELCILYVKQYYFYMPYINNILQPYFLLSKRSDLEEEYKRDGHHLVLLK